MEKITYKQYSKDQMLKIIKKEPFVFVETNLGNNYIIKQKDLADFIILEALRTCLVAEMEVYMPGIENPVLTTFGWFLNKTNSLLREEIIKRLTLLQTTDKKPKNVKIFNNETFIAFSKKQLGIENGKVKNFNKLYKKYEDAQNEYNIQMKGVFN